MELLKQTTNQKLDRCKNHHFPAEISTFTSFFLEYAYLTSYDAGNNLGNGVLAVAWCCSDMACTMHSNSKCSTHQERRSWKGNIKSHMKLVT